MRETKCPTCGTMTVQRWPKPSHATADAHAKAQSSWLIAPAREPTDPNHQHSAHLTHKPGAAGANDLLGVVAQPTLKHAMHCHLTTRAFWGCPHQPARSKSGTGVITNAAGRPLACHKHPSKPTLMKMALLQHAAASAYRPVTCQSSSQQVVNMTLRVSGWTTPCSPGTCQHH